MEIYQGTPLGFLFAIRKGRDKYIESFDGYTVEVVLYRDRNHRHLFSTADGSVSVGRILRESLPPVGYISFGLNGAETSGMGRGSYHLEVSMTPPQGTRTVVRAEDLATIYPTTLKER